MMFFVSNTMMSDSEFQLLAERYYLRIFEVKSVGGQMFFDKKNDRIHLNFYKIWYMHQYTRKLVTALVLACLHLSLIHI